MASVAKKVSSSWVDCVGLKDNVLFVEFKAYPGKGKVCCSYPGCGQAYYNLALGWASKGRFVHDFLYKLRPYRIIKCPCADILAIEPADFELEGSGGALGGGTVVLGIGRTYFGSGGAVGGGVADWSFDAGAPELARLQGHNRFINTIDTTVLLQWDNPTTEGSLLVACAHLGAETNLFQTPDGWTLVDEADTPGFAVYYKENAASESGQLFETDGGTFGTDVPFCYAEYTGAKTSDALDAIDDNNGSGTSLNSGTIAETAQAKEVVIAVFAFLFEEGVQPASDFDNDFSFVAENNINSRISMADKILDEVEEDVTCNATKSSDNNWRSLIIAFKGA